VSVTQQEMPGVTFAGKVTRTSEAINTATRTLQVEITLPGNTLLFRAEGPHMAVVGADNTVRLKPVEIAQDLGQTLVIEHGLDASDRVVLNPSDSIADGDNVTVVAPGANGANGANGAGGVGDAAAKRSTT
jgi:hypothetical protein